MVLSANALFHFVDKREYLEDILNGIFYPRYCWEIFKFNMVNCTEAIIPMKCFCDIPLSQISKHTDLYGKFGIGFTKEWALSRKITPVLYVHNISPILDMIRYFCNVNINMIYEHYGNGFRNTKEDQDYCRALRQTYSIEAFIKPYYGDMKRKEKICRVKFYNEREWRYVPMIGASSHNELEIIYPNGKDSYNNDYIEKLNNKSKKDFNLKFTSKNIKYIFVESKQDIEPICDTIYNSSKFKTEEKKILCTKILTLKQIKEDF